MAEQRDPDASGPGSVQNPHHEELPMVLPALAVLALIVILAAAAWYVSSRVANRGGSQDSGAAAAEGTP